MKQSPLASALRFGSIKDVCDLLISGENPNGLGDFHISSDSFEQKVDALIEAGWEIDRCQLLHDAKHGLGKRVEVYLERGANPNAADSTGQTALHKFAALGIGKSAICALLEAGADISAKDERGRTPLDLAKDAKKDVAFKTLSALLEAAGTRPDRSEPATRSEAK